MHFCRHGGKHVQSFKKTGLKLYEKLQSQGTYCLYIWGQKMTNFKKYKKVTKIWQRLYEKHMHIFRLLRKHVQSCKKISIKLYEELCTQGTHCLYTEGEKWLSTQCGKSENKNVLTITSKSRAHPHIMKKTHAMFHNNRYKTVEEMRSQEVPTVYI